MVHFNKIEEYLLHFEESIHKSEREHDELLIYFKEQGSRLTQLIETINASNFWITFPEILGIDAKLMLISELVNYDDFPTKDILRIVEEDYRYYFKELCGYDLSMETKSSMIFRVL